jgi:hypothetical protein
MCLRDLYSDLLFFSIFISLVGLVICSHQVDHEQYGSVFQLCISFSPQLCYLEIDTDTLQGCMLLLYIWFSLCKLLLDTVLI